jgi:hypothetical protein
MTSLICLLTRCAAGGLSAASKSRIVVHCLATIVNDLLPNYSYNMYTSRFVPSPAVGRKTQYLHSAPKGHVSAAIYGSLCHKAYEHQVS